MPQTFLHSNLYNFNSIHTQDNLYSKGKGLLYILALPNISKVKQNEGQNINHYHIPSI